MKRNTHLPAHTTKGLSGQAQCHSRAQYPAADRDLVRRRAESDGDCWCRQCLRFLTAEYLLSATRGATGPIGRAERRALFGYMTERVKKHYGRMSPEEITEWEQDAEDFGRSLMSMRGTSMPVIKEDDDWF